MCRENALDSTWTNPEYSRSAIDWPRSFSTANRSWWTSSLTYPFPVVIWEMPSQRDRIEDRHTITDHDLRCLAIFFSGVANSVVRAEKSQNEADGIIDQSEREESIHRSGRSFLRGRLTLNLEVAETRGGIHKEVQSNAEEQDIDRLGRRESEIMSPRRG